MRYLDPSIDYVFKILFREPSDETRLIAMLTAILEPTSPIRWAKVQNPELPADIANAKSIVLDVLVSLSDGRTVDIEMETWPRPIFVARDLFYWARAHGKQLGDGDDYHTLRPTISIAWLADPRDGRRAIVDSTRVHTRYRIYEATTKEQLTDQLEIHFLDLRKLKTDATLSPALRRWAEFFDHPTEHTLLRLAEEDQVMADTINKLATVSADDQSYHIAESRFKGEVARRLDIAYERQEGRAEGHAEGRTEGRTEGRAEGRAAARRDTVLEIVAARFGGVPAELPARLETLDEDALQALVTRAAVASSLEDFVSF